MNAAAHNEQLTFTELWDQFHYPPDVILTYLARRSEENEARGIRAPIYRSFYTR
jgi:hypothetical protein